jgi:transposase
MQTITTIGLDIAKSVFQVHGVDAGGQVVIRRQLKEAGQLFEFISAVIEPLNQYLTTELHRGPHLMIAGALRERSSAKQEPWRKNQASPLRG